MRKPRCWKSWLPSRFWPTGTASVYNVKVAVATCYARTGLAVVTKLTQREKQTKMKSTDRILTTHVGSLPRPQEVVDLLFAQDRGDAIDAKQFDATIRAAVADAVEQASAGRPGSS